MQVDGEGRLPVGVRGVVRDEPASNDSGVVDEDRYLADLLTSASGKLTAGLPVGDVEPVVRCCVAA